MGLPSQTVTRDRSYAKIDENTVEITDTVTTVDVIVSTYILDDLIYQKKQIETDKQTIIQSKDDQIRDIDKLISDVQGVGVTPLDPSLAASMVP